VFQKGSASASSPWCLGVSCEGWIVCVIELTTSYTSSCETRISSIPMLSIRGSSPWMSTIRGISPLLSVIELISTYASSCEGWIVCVMELTTIYASSCEARISSIPMLGSSQILWIVCSCSHIPVLRLSCMVNIMVMLRIERFVRIIGTASLRHLASWLSNVQTAFNFDTVRFHRSTLLMSNMQTTSDFDRFVVL